MATPLPSLPEELFDPEAFGACFEQQRAVECCKEAIARATHYLHREFRSQAQTGHLLRLRAAFIDALLGELWDRQGWSEENLSLVAVGGYGRGELHPQSDVDILVLLGPGFINAAQPQQQHHPLSSSPAIFFCS